MDIKSWTLKNYYELEYFEQAFSLIDSYKHFLTKNKSLSDHFRERHMNFLKFSEELFKIKSRINVKPDAGIKKHLDNTVNIVHKEWLSEKISEALT